MLGIASMHCAAAVKAINAAAGTTLRWSKLREEATESAHLRHSCGGSGAVLRTPTCYRRNMGADHCWPASFNSCDLAIKPATGAYFTRPPAASMAARLTLDVCGRCYNTGTDREGSTALTTRSVDLACGSGTLLTAMLTST